MRQGIRRFLLLLGGTVLVATTALAQQTGNCAPGEAEALLYVNDVRARLLNNGSLFWSGSPSIYEVPKGEGVHAIFAAGIWMGGMVDGTLRMAGSTYGPYEFWPGPLQSDGTLPEANDCSAFDRIYEVGLVDLVEFENNGTVSENLEQWPWELGAPVVDGDGNADNYNLAGGDRPAILGHQTQWWVMNDLGGAHARTGGRPLGMEVQVSAFAALTDDAVSQTTLYQYKLLYRGQAALEDAYFGLFADADLGQFNDDYVGSDTTLGLAFVYNADNNDESLFGYGANPPSLGIQFVEGPVNALGETLRMTNFMTYQNGGGVQGDPQNAADYYNYMQSRWRDGEPLTLGGFGRDSSATSIATRFFFSGDPVQEAFWSELNADGNGTAIPASDRRFVMSAGPFNMQPGDEQVITLAIVWARGTDYLDSITQLRAASQTVQDAWDAGFDFPFDIEAPSQAPVLLAPADGTADHPDRLTLHWERADGVSGYEVEVATDAAFSNLVRSERLPGVTALDLEDLQPVTTFYWRVRSENPGGVGPWSDAFAFTTTDLMFENLGPLLLSDGTPAFVEVAGPGGADPCSPGATSTDGCDDVGGNGVYGSLNSSGDYVMYHLGSAGPESTIGAYAPNDYEIRFTAEGSFAFHLFTSSRVIPVPFEIWDIGPTAPGADNDPSDDVRMIPVVFSDNGDECRYGYGEVPPSQSPLNLSWAGTERAYGYYATTTYGDWEAAVDSLVEHDPQRCPVFNGDNQIDFDRGRPLQRVVFFGNDTGAQFRPEGPPEGTVVRFYSTTVVHAPVLAAPVSGATDLAQPLTLWWNMQSPSRAHVQVSTTAGFTDIAAEADDIFDDHYAINNLPDGAYFWRVRRRDGAGRPGPWSTTWEFGLSASKAVAKEAEGEVPTTYALEQNYPNPFNPETVIRFALPQAGSVRLEVFDMLGRRVATLINGSLPAGWHTAVWQAQGVSSGLYLYRVQAGAYHATRRMLLVN